LGFETAQFAAAGEGVGRLGMARSLREMQRGDGIGKIRQDKLGISTVFRTTSARS
jgi:hypothetical protein